MSRPIRCRPLALSLLSVVLCGAACQSPDAQGAPDSTPRTEAEIQADKLAAAKEAAREAAIEDLYAQWRYEYLAYLEGVEAARATDEPEDALGPVRSLDELLQEADPETFDPAVRERFEAWVEISEAFDARLRQLRSDPESDPRSPLRPDVREALRGDPVDPSDG